MSKYVRHVSETLAPSTRRWSSLDVELTERCDNNCVHCYINLPAGDRGALAREMSTDQVKDVLSQAADLGFIQVRFTGGEPLLRPDFEELYVFARRLGMKVLIYTNARQITAGLADLWTQLPPLVPIEVSVYGMRQESYEAVSRVSGSYVQFRHGVDLLLSRGIPFEVKGIVVPANRCERDEFEAWAATIPGTRVPPSYSMFFDLRGRRDNPAKNRLIESLRVSAEEALEILARDEVGYRQQWDQFRARHANQPSDRLFGCGAGRHICIDAYGQAQACMGLRAPNLTIDTLTHSLAEVIEHFKALQDMRTANPEYLKRCAVCSLRGFCDQCPAKSWAEHGTLDTPVEYLCEVAHEKARFMGWLDESQFGWKS